MALPTAPSFASFDVTDRTQGRSVHSVLLDAVYALSDLERVLAAPGRTSGEQRHEWISLRPPIQTVTAAATTNTDVGDGSASATSMELSAGHGARVQPGTLLMNTSVATPIGTYQRNEILEVTAVSTDTLTVVRDAGAFNSGTGSTAHTNTSVYRILYTPLQEGSLASADPNTYQADDILENYTAIQSFKMQLTGSQKARRMEVVDSEVERQWQVALDGFTNKRASMHLYGYNSSTAVGSDTVIRNSKGILDFLVDNIVSTNPLVDYTSTTLTYDVINALFIKLFNNGVRPSNRYKIVTSAVTKDVISSWESDKVRTTLDTSQVGREITVFKSTLGFEAEIIAEPMVLKNDVFIIDPTLIRPMIFREYTKEAWGKGTPAPNGDDMWYQRYLGEETLMVINPGTAHAAITYLTWV